MQVATEFFPEKLKEKSESKEKLQVENQNKVSNDKYRGYNQAVMPNGLVPMETKHYNNTKLQFSNFQTKQYMSANK